MALRSAAACPARPCSCQTDGRGLETARAWADGAGVFCGDAGVFCGDAGATEDDVIVAIDGQEARNSVVATVLFGKAGTTVKLRVRRPKVLAEDAKTITIARNALGLGLVVDSTNTITDLVAGSAAAEHRDG